MSTAQTFAATHALAELMERITPPRPVAGPPPTLAELLRFRDEILSLAKTHGATDVRAVGSVARGTASRTSDVDLLVRLSPDSGLTNLAALQADLEALLDCRVHVIPEFTLAERPLAESLRERALRDRLDADAVRL